MEQNKIFESLCYYDARNPNNTIDKEDLVKDGCNCDNCFYGRTKLAEALLENDIKNEEEKRCCSECKKTMVEGYVVNGGEEHYCSDDCLHKKYTHEEFLELHDNGNGDSYWTSWVEDLPKELIEKQAITVIVFDEDDIDEYLEIHFEMVQHILNTEDTEGTEAHFVQDTMGTSGKYELAKNLTDQFVTEHGSKIWGVDADFFDTLQEFLTNNENKFNPSQK